MTALEIFYLLGSATVAGGINAVAGGGTILTFPTLLAIGTLPVMANATSTVALVLGTSGSVYGFRQQFPTIRRWLWRFVPVSLLGGAIGSWLLTLTGNDLFKKLVPFLILFATLIFLIQGLVARMAKHSCAQESRPSRLGWAILFQFFIAIYGGFFGAGIGILMLAGLGFIGLNDVHQMNALKNLLGCLINAVAAIMFIALDFVDWPKVGIMTLGAITGYYLGSHYSQKIPQLWVRRLVLGIGFGISGISFYRQFC